jgi:hypothetical protein
MEKFCLLENLVALSEMALLCIAYIGLSFQVKDNKVIIKMEIILDLFIIFGKTTQITVLKICVSILANILRSNIR